MKELELLKHFDWIALLIGMMVTAGLYEVSLAAGKRAQVRACGSCLKGVL